jgi:hypothetical protein
MVVSLAGVDASLTPPHIQQQQMVQIDQQLLQKKITNKIPTSRKMRNNK